MRAAMPPGYRALSSVAQGARPAAKDADGALAEAELSEFGGDLVVVAVSLVGDVAAHDLAGLWVGEDVLVRRRPGIHEVALAVDVVEELLDLVGGA